MELCQQNKAFSGYGEKIDHFHLKSSINLQQYEYNGMVFYWNVLPMYVNLKDKNILFKNIISFSQAN